MDGQQLAELYLKKMAEFYGWTSCYYVRGDLKYCDGRGSWTVFPFHRHIFNAWDLADKDSLDWRKIAYALTDQIASFALDKDEAPDSAEVMIATVLCDMKESR